MNVENSCLVLPWKTSKLSTQEQPNWDSNNFFQFLQPMQQSTLLINNLLTQ